jgi:hypothetical protein
VLSRRFLGGMDLIDCKQFDLLYMESQIVFSFNDDLKDELHDRSRRLIRNCAPVKLNGCDLSIHFLRGVFSRATQCVPAYYYFIGSASSYEVANKSSDYPFRVAQSYSEFSDLNTLTLNCRKLFDHSTSTNLTGHNFSKLSNEALTDHAKYWAKNSSCKEEEAFKALRFLRRFFMECSQSDTNLLQANSQLQKRIGLLKQHADRAAAHLSLQEYSLKIADLTHFTAACVMIGEIIRSFDMPDISSNYFNELDTASYSAAKRIFPQIANFQMFANLNLENQARSYWRFNEDDGIHILLNHLQDAVGGDPIE